MRKVIVMGAKNQILGNILIAQTVATVVHAQGKEPDRGLVIIDKPINPNPQAAALKATEATPIINGGKKKRQTANRQHVQIGSYKFNGKKNKK